MASKFEKLIEYVIANDDKKARSLFHQIVVDKSRRIYEALDVDNTERAFDDVEADHTASGENFDEFGGDEADDLESDVFVDGGEEMGLEGETDLNPEIDDRVADLEQEFDSLKAEFEQLLHSEEGEEEGEEEGLGDEEEGLEGLESAVEGEEDETEHIEDEVESDEPVEEEEEAEEDDEEKEEPVDESVIREYVLKVTQGLAKDSEEGFVQKKSPIVAKPSIVPGIGPKNLNQGGVSQGRPNPKAGEMIGDKEVVNRPGRKSVELKPTPKPVTSKEEGGVNKKSIES
jgi:hypothetical protein